MKLSKAVEGYCIDRIAEGYSSSTVSSYRYSLKILVNFLEDPEIETVTSQDLKRFFYFLRTDYKPYRPNGNTAPLAGASLHGKWKACRSFWNWASSELSMGDPAKELQAPAYTCKAITPFSREEIGALLKACDHTAPARTGNRIAYTQRRPTGMRDKAIILVLLDTGLRLGELSRLQIQDVSLETGEIRVLPYGQGKKTAGRVVHLGKAGRRSLWRYLAARDPLSDDPLFLNDKDQPISEGAIKQLCRRLGARAGIKSVHPHRFRHTFAIQYLRNGGDVFTLQRLLGHKSLDMVKNYLELAQTDAATAHQRASPVDRWGL
jgi:integrase/recombinase XerD